MLSTPDGLYAHQCSMPLFVVFDPEMDPHRADLYWQGFEYWNDILGFEMFINGGFDDSHNIYESEIILVRDAYESEEFPPYVCALTVYKTVVGTGCATYQQVISTGFCDKGDVFTLSVARHEVGHVLGLAHNEELPGDLMEPTLGVQKTVRRASPGDVKILREIYPAPN